MNCVIRLRVPVYLMVCLKTQVWQPFIVPSGVKEIGKYAFRNNKSIAISFEGPQEGF